MIARVFQMFRFTIRDLLWLTTLSAALVAWWLDHTKTRIDWQYVRTNEQQLRAAKEQVFWAQMQAQTAQQQKASLVRAAAHFGVTQLDIQAETRIHQDLLEGN
jgi:ABC-type uncharacterized transport system permease subunit